MATPELYPLTAAQTDIWFGQVVDPDNSCYNVAQYCEIPEAIDPALFEECVREAVAALDSLRLCFVTVGASPGQFVRVHVDFDLPYIDASGSADPLAVALAWMRADKERPFDLANGPPFRFALIKAAENLFYWYGALHHIVADGIGSSLLVGHVADRYRLRLLDPPAEPEQPVPWRRVLEDEAAYRQSPRWERDRAYWVDRLRDRPGAATLSGLSSSPPGRTLGCDGPIPRSSVERLARLGAANGAGLSAVVTAVAALYLARMVGTEDVILGMPVSARTSPELRRAVGMVANVVPLRLAVGPAAPLGELLRQSAVTMRSALRHQRYPASALRRDLSLQANQPEIFGTMINFIPMGQDIRFCDRPMRRHNLGNWRVGDLMITAHVADADSDIRIELAAHASHYDADTVEMHLRRLLRLFETIASADPAIAVGQLPLALPDERHLVLDGWNATTVALPTTTLPELFAAQVVRTPNAVALVYGQTELSYAALETRANRLARCLAGQGIGPESLVALALPRSLDLIVALLAVLKAGAAFVALDPGYPAQRLAFMLRDCRASRLIGTSRTLAAIGALGTALPPTLLMDDQEVTRRLDALPGHELADSDRTAPLRPENLAYVVYTSGSTGTPKAVGNTVAGLINRLAWQWHAVPYVPGEVACAKTSPNFVDSVTEILAPLLRGVLLVIADADQGRDPRALAALVARRHITRLTLVPSLLGALLETPSDLAGLRVCVCSGEALSRALANRFHDRLPKASLWNHYGASEANGDSIAARIEPDDAPVGIGRPIWNTRIYLLDATLSPVPVGVAGELFIAGAGLARGYPNRPALTAERFVADPFGPPGSRMYRSFDLARWRPDGVLEYLGRIDRQIKIRGIRVEPGEIEAALAAQPGIAGAAVIARDDGPAGPYLAAYLVASAPPEPAALRRALGQTLPAHMIPTAFVALDALPLAPNGKLDREALPPPVRHTAPDCGHEPPQGPYETALAAIWAELLGLDYVGRHDNFFELGGHSLLAIGLIERVRRLGWQTDVRSVFAEPTLAALAATLGAGEAAVAVPPNRIGPGCTRIVPDMLPLATLSQPQIDSIVATVPGGAGNVQDIYPLLPLQEGILFHARMAADDDSYVLRALLAFDSRARLDRFLAALQWVVDRHDALRTAVLWDGLPEPVQVVWRKATLPVVEIALNGDDPASHARTMFHAQHGGMDVYRAPLARALIADVTSGGRWLLLLQTHHLTMDRTTLELILGEVRAHLAGETAHLPPPVPLRAFVAQARRAPAREDHEAFFRQMLGDIDEPTAPFGLLDVRGTGAGIAEGRMQVEPELAHRLRGQARRLGVTAASLFHLAWALVLARTTGRREIVFGTVLFGRMHSRASIDRAFGLFVNTLPLRVSVDATGAEQAVRDTHLRLAQLLRHEHASLSLAQRCSAVPPPAPLFSALLNYRYARQAAGSGSPMPGMELLRVDERSNYPVSLSVDDVGDGFELVAQVSDPIEPIRVCGFVHTALERLAWALEEAPEAGVRSLDVLPAGERRRVLFDWNATDAPLPPDRCIHELFEAQAARTPHAIAVIAENVELTYGELNERANRLAHRLVALGVTPDARVAIALPRSADMIVAVLATLKAGGAYVPLDLAYPAVRLAFTIEDSAARVLLTRDGSLPALGPLAEDLLVLKLDTDASTWAACPATNPAPRALGLAPSNLAYVIYTSGSTGAPKGVMATHRNLAHSTHARLLYYTQTLWRFLLLPSFAFDSSVACIFWTLCRGGALVVPGDGRHLDVATLANLVAEHAVTHVLCVPSLYAALLDKLTPAARDTLTTAIVAGEACSAALVARHTAKLPNAALYNEYGPTECSVWSSVHRCDSHDSLFVPIGRPIANTRIYLLDAGGAPVPVGVAGEICIAGAGVARGYLNRDDTTAERFVIDPFAAEAGHADGQMYRTGDLAAWTSDGRLKFLGRNDRQVKIRGYRIEPGEIENRLREYPGIEDATVLDRDDRSGEKRLVAYVTGVPVPTLASLRMHLAETLPGYMLPTAFVHLDALPLTANGKLDRAALPAPSEWDETGGQIAGEPQTPTETALARIWCDVLRIALVGRADDFFDLGGHSLTALQVVSQIQDAFRIELPLRTMFDVRTLEALANEIDAALLEGRHAPRLPPIARAADINSAPLSFSQERLWLIQSLSPQTTAYNIAFVVRFAGPLDSGALSAAFDEIYRRHDMLRSTVRLENGQPVQDVAPWSAGVLACVDLRERGGEAKAIRLAEADARTPFDLARGPAIRATLYCTGRDGHLLTIVLHHIAGDQWSLGVLGRELALLYNNARRGIAANLPPLPIGYRDYAVWQRHALTDAEFGRQMQFWRRQLADLPPLELPTDRPRPPIAGMNGALRRTPIPPQLLADLERIGRRAGNTLFMTMLAAFATLLHRLGGQHDIPIGVPVANRTRSATEGLIGTFVNTLILRIDLSGDPPFRDLLHRVRATALDAFAHQDVSFDRLVQELATRSDPSRAPLAQAMFNVTNAPMHGIAFDGTTWEAEQLDRGGAQFELSLAIDTQTTRIVTVEYDTDLFDSATIDRLTGHYFTLLAGVVGTLDTRLSDLPLLADDERETLRRWNATPAPYPPTAFSRLFEAQAARTPTAPAISCEGVVLTYADLNARANAVAQALRGLGIGPNDTVGVCVPRSPALLSALLGVQKSGGAYVPLDPDFPAERLRYMLADSGARVLVTAGNAAAALDVPAGIATLDLDQPSSLPTGNLEAGPATRDTAYVIYTSGSTGRPKGVAVSHGALANFLHSMRQTPGLAPSDVLAAVTTISFDIAGLELYLPLLVGARIELVPRRTAVDGRALSRRLAESGATTLQATPATWRLLVEADWPGAPGLRALCGGERLPRDLADALLPRVAELWNLYGPTETTIWSTIERVEAGTSPVAIGRPIANTQIHILDAAWQSLPVGIVGEICIGGAGVADGYLRRPAQTAERFIPDVFSDRPGGRLYRTGDLGRWGPDGKLYHLGRMDHQVKVRGLRIEPGEIESVLRTHPAVQEAVVTAAEAQPGDLRLVAYVVYRDGEDLTAGDVRRYLRRDLPEHMIPSTVLALAAIPLTPNGKLDRSALPDPFRNAKRAAVVREPPAPGAEQMLAEIWQSVLKVDSVAADDNFFEIGGHSLLSLRVAQLVEKRSGVRMDPRALFFRNLRQVAAQIASPAAAAGKTRSKTGR